MLPEVTEFPSLGTSRTHNQFRREDELLCRVQREKVPPVKQLRFVLEEEEQQNIKYTKSDFSLHRNREKLTSSASSGFAPLRQQFSAALVWQQLVSCDDV